MYDITQSYVRSVLHYDPLTGYFTSLVTTKNYKVGQIVGHTHEGYIRLTVKGVRVFAHRLAFLYMTGNWPSPEKQIDHINRNRSDNRWSNLRVCTKQQNMLNVDRTKGASRFRGVTWSRNNASWKAEITITKVKYYLGCYKCELDAATIINLYVYNFMPIEDLKYFEYNEAKDHGYTFY